MDRTSRMYARIAGILYLTTHVTSVTAVIAYGGESTRLGVLLEFLLALGCAGTGILLWLLLRDRGPAKAAAFLMLRTIEAAVILAGALPMLAIAFGGSPRLTGLHTAAFLLGQGLVISVNTIILGWLLIESRAVPRPLAVLGAAGGTIVLVSNVAQLFDLIPLNGTIAGLCAAPVFAFEIWFAIHLIVRGIRS